MAKKRKQKSNRQRLHKSSTKNCKGVWLRWVDNDPLGNIKEPVTAEFGSSNPVVHLQMRDRRFLDALCVVLDAKRFCWVITVEMDFGNETKTQQIRGIARLPNLTEGYERLVESMFQDAVDKNYIDKFSVARIHQEVISHQEYSTDCEGWNEL